MPDYNPNLKTVIIKAPDKAEKEFVWIEKEDLYKASKFLTPAQLLVYIDMCGNKDGWKYDFYPAHFVKHYNISKETARSAFKALEAAGYITEKDGNYYFTRTTEQLPPDKE